jgi:tRNA threonylcarbamoyladenosine biosynthesis protein TsaB
MFFAAIETSSLRGSVALFSGDDGLEGCIEETVFPEGLVHGREITARLGELLGRSGRRARDLEGLAVSVGPGSYTGCRVGVTAAKCLALALRVPVAAVSSLEVLAAGAARDLARVGCDDGCDDEGGGEVPLAPVLDGRRGFFYAAGFAARRSGILRRFPDRLGRAEDVAAWLEASSLVFGDGADLLMRAVRECLGPAPFERGRTQWDFPRALVLGELAAPRLRGSVFDLESIHGIEVRYLRPSEPEIVWSERWGGSGPWAQDARECEP